MAKMTAKALAAWEANRDIGAEILKGVKDMKAGRIARTHQVQVSPIIAARNRTGLSQANFAKALGVSTRTLQDWEQGRRQPSGAARSLLAIAVARPEVVKEVLTAK